MNGITANSTLEAELGEALEVKAIMAFKQFDSAHLQELVRLGHLYSLLGEEIEGKHVYCLLLCGGAAGGRRSREEEAKRAALSYFSINETQNNPITPCRYPRCSPCFDLVLPFDRGYGVAASSASGAHLSGATKTRRKDLECG